MRTPMLDHQSADTQDGVRPELTTPAAQPSVDDPQTLRSQGQAKLFPTGSHSGPTSADKEASWLQKVCLGLTHWGKDGYRLLGQ